jgi:hypothetical protein
MSEQARFLTTLRPQCSSLLEKVASPNASDLDIWTAVVQLIDAFDSLRATPRFNGSNAAVAISSDVVKYLKNDWTSTFIGDSLRTLQNVIWDFECQPKENRDEFYARTLVFLQSSGMGKSRLADAFGQECPMINYVLREKGTLGFPPADDDILSFMRKHPSNDQEEHLIKSPKNSPQKKFPKRRTDITWYHSLAVGLLQASFEILNTWVKTRSRDGMRLNDLAALRHKEMAYNSESERSESEGHPSRPSRQRTNFCKEVATRAEEIADILIQKPSWRRVFDLEGRSTIRHELITNHHLNDLLDAARTLTDNLGGFQSENRYDPPLVVVFDEASSLLKEPGGIRSARYVALNRIMSCLREYRIWFFIISTESQVGTIIPPDNAERTNDSAEDPSLRFAYGLDTQLKRIPPFLAFQLNIEDIRRMQYPTQDELGKSLSDFGKPKHMAMFGRRLWYAYIDDPEQMNKLAKVKLIGGVQKGTYIPHNEHHVFAALSFRLSLDASLHNLKAIPLIRTAINSHMRVAMSIDQDTGTIGTLAPSEPILAKAAMEYLCSGINWSVSIDTLARELLEKGLVEKGLKGELYARLVLTLAHDWVRCRQGQQVSGEDDGELDQETNSGGGIHQESDPDFRPKFMKSFTVRAFLEALYANANGHKSTMKIDLKILEARMNFTHFATTRENLCPEVLSDLLVDLLRRGAALQLAPAQPKYDILIPIYLGKEDEVLEPSKCSCIVVQVKNRIKTTTPGKILQGAFTIVEDRKRKASGSPSTKAEKEKDPKAEYVFSEMENPILFLLFDFGGARTKRSIAASVEVSHDSADVPRVWTIHSRGHDEKVFGCISLMGCADAGKMFFTSAVPGVSMHEQTLGINDVFQKLGRSFRYLPVMEGTGKSETENEDKDMGMEGGYGMVEGDRERGSKRRRGMAEEDEGMDVEMDQAMTSSAKHADRNPRPKPTKRKPTKR